MTNEPVGESGDGIREIVSEQTFKASAFRGPLPPPIVLEEYERVIPGAAERIIRMAEQQAAHRQSLEKSVAEAEIEDARSSRLERRRGQFLGAAICVIAIIFGALTSILSEGTAGQIGGAVIGGAALVSLVSAFISGGRSEATAPD